MKFDALLHILFMLVILTGCSVDRRAEPYELPSDAIAAVVQDAEQDSLFTEGPLPNEWWRIFEDDQLTAFIEKAFERNPTLQISRENVLAAAYNADLAAAPLFPNLNWNGDVSRQKFSETGIIPFQTNNPTSSLTPLPAPGGIDGIPVYFTQYETELILGFDFDIWGKNRNNWYAAIGEVYSKMADDAFSRLQLGIAVAQAYFQLQVDYKRREIVQKLVENQNNYNGLVGQRNVQNIESQQPVLTYQSRLASVQQGLLEIERDIIIRENQLRAYLADSFDDPIFIRDIEERSLPQIPLPTNLPVHLLAYRPDIIAQLWLIESAGRQIDVAKAGFYPDFNITALYGYQTIHWRKLFNYPSTFFNADPAFSLPIFTGGRLTADLRISEVNYDLAIYQYNNTVINAIQEVLNGIRVFRNYDEQLHEFMKQTKQQADQLYLSRLRFENNLDSRLTYLTTEQNYLTAKDQETVALGNTVVAALALIKALGGGYDECN